MKILLDIPDNKASSLMDVLRSISYVKAKQLTEAKALLIEEIREVVDERKARNAEDFLNSYKGIVLLCPRHERFYVISQRSGEIPYV